ncbi:MAG: short-chain dehydrogenase [Bacteroides sp. SM23_62_1]|nr:MAG: short-chain dehydrogenase [Bacteroides sp. SM23_62_1]
MKKIALVTGATAGIGKATAQLLARNNFDVIITGRRNNLLAELKTAIESETGAQVLPLCFDVQIYNEVVNALESLPDRWKNTDVLINNAGLAAGLDFIQEGSLIDWEQMIDTNVKGLLYITRIVSGWMIPKKAGHIVNIGSIAGREVYEKGSVYCATKFAVDALSRGMRIDLVSHNIKVTCIEPGMVNTEFSLVRFKGDRKRADKVYEGVTPLYAEDIAEAILFAVTRPPHVNINEMLIMPTAQAAATIVHRE